MKIKDLFLEVVDKTEEMLDDYVFKCESRFKPQHFSREKKMGFKDTMLFILNHGRRSLQLELNSFFRKVLKKKYTIKLPSYKENREKIKPKAFQELNKMLVQKIYSCEDYKLYKGYRLLAVDGSVVEVPDTSLLKKEFGEAINQSKGKARARVLSIYDVLNEVIIKSKICSYNTGERTIATESFSEIKHDGMLGKKDLFIFDRGFVKRDLFADVLDSGCEILVRMPRKSLKEVTQARKQDQNIILNIKGKSYILRVVRFTLSSGEEEILLTSLKREKHYIKDLKKLYFLRWGVETNFDILKNKLEIENFTSRSKITVEQDFYATIFLYNMANLAKKQSDYLISKKHRFSDLKYSYKTNFNILIGTIKEEFIELIMEKSNRKRRNKFKTLISLISQSIIPVRLDRSFARNKRKVLTKYKPNHKRCL